MSRTAALIAAILLAIYAGMAVWMNVFAFADHNCGSTVFSATWPVWAVDKQLGLRSDWLEKRIVGVCL